MALLEEHLLLVLTGVVTPSISEQSLFLRGTVLQPEHLGWSPGLEPS